jgi:hypothetical protein
VREGRLLCFPSRLVVGPRRSKDRMKSVPPERESLLILRTPVGMAMHSDISFAPEVLPVARASIAWTTFSQSKEEITMRW